VAYFNRYVPERLPRGSYADAQTFSGEICIRKNGKVSHRSCQPWMRIEADIWRAGGVKLGTGSLAQNLGKPS
jgi:hypothetical protein